MTTLVLMYMRNGSQRVVIRRPPGAVYAELRAAEREGRWARFPGTSFDPAIVRVRPVAV